MWKFYVFRLAYALLGWLPLRALYAIARIVGDGAYFVRSSAREAVIDNMRHVMPAAPEQELRRGAREAFRNATRYYADLIEIPRLDVERFARERLTVDGLEHVIAARDSGRGAVIVSAHFGNPEMAVQGLAAFGVTLFGLTEPIHPKALSDFTHSLRRRHGHEYRTVSFGGVKETVRRLRGGGVVALLVDRDVGNAGVPIEFFGEVAHMPLGAYELALRSGADIIPAWSLREPGYRFYATIGPPIEVIRTDDFDADVRAAARKVLDLLEQRVRSAPGQWAVLERVWGGTRN